MASVQAGPSGNKVIKLVLDSAAFIKQVKIETIGQEFFTLPEVIKEIRDSKARHFLANFPFEIKEMSPDPAAFQAVVAFSKETGDYPSLSLTDLKVLALTYTLEHQVHGNVDHIRTTPQKLVETDERPNGFFTPKIPTGDLTDEEDDEEAQMEPTGVGAWAEGDTTSGWITPDNIQQYTATFTEVTHPQGAVDPIKVACLTLDFSMQNVLLQMNMNLISVDGVTIRSSQRWIRRCYACHQLVKEPELIYCKHCGGVSLQKISYTVDKDGSVTYHIPKHKRSLRGTKYPIPQPKSGRHNKFITSPQQLPKQRPVKKDDMDMEDPDAAFATSRHAHAKPVIGYGNKNPNQARRKIGKKNKTKGREF